MSLSTFSFLLKVFWPGLVLHELEKFFAHGLYSPLLGTGDHSLWLAQALTLLCARFLTQGLHVRPWGAKRLLELLLQSQTGCFFFFLESCIFRQGPRLNCLIQAPLVCGEKTV